MSGNRYLRKFRNAHSFLLPSPSGKVSIAVRRLTDEGTPDEGVSLETDMPFSCLPPGESLDEGETLSLVGPSSVSCFAAATFPEGEGKRKECANENGIAV